MDAFFHLPESTSQTGYHRDAYDSIGLFRRFLELALCLCLMIGLPTPTAAAPGSAPVSQPAAAARTSISNGATSEPSRSGFAPPSITLLAPLVHLAPPGPRRAARAIGLFDHQISFYRSLFFHPVFSPALSRVVELMPPRQATLLLAPSLYSRPDIPWRRDRDGVHHIDVVGAPSHGDYLYSLAPADPAAVRPGQFRGRFALRPSPGQEESSPSSIIGKLNARVRSPEYGLAGLIDVASAALGECYGDLQGPWDRAPGRFNRHDRAAIRRFRRDLPLLSARLSHYFRAYNILDEFAGRDDTPVVLFNLDAEVRADSLKPFPHLYRFYSRIAPRVDADAVLTDAAGARWIIFGFHRGRIRIIFMDAAGSLQPFDDQFAPAGAPLRLDALVHGRYQTALTLHYTRFGLTFGIDQLDFATDYYRDHGAVRFVSRMTTVPQVVAPFAIRQIVALVANSFLTAMAHGNGGMRIGLASRPLDGRGAMVDGSWSSELRYSPGLGILARVADAIADAHNQAVRADERRLGEELFDAFIRDYNAQKPRLLALDAHAAAP